MAITNTVTPNRWNRRKGRIMFSFLSDEIAQPNFRYAIQVYIGNSTVAFATYLVQPNEAGWVHFDMSSILGNRVKVDTKNPDYSDIVHDLPSDPDFIFSKSATGFGRFRISCKEYYGTPPILIASTTVFHDIAVIDGFTPIHLGDSYNLYDDFGTVAMPSKFWLSDRPTNSDDEIELKAGKGDRGAVAFINNIWSTLGGGSLHAIEYEIYNGSTLLGDETIAISTATGTQLPSNSGYASGKLTYMGVLPDNLSDADSPIATADRPNNLSWTHYLLYPVDNTGARVGSYLRVNNTPHPCKHEPVMLTWGNSVGGWELFRMDGRTEVRETSQGKQYQKLTGSYNAAAFAYQPYDRGTEEWSIKRDITYTLKSAPLRDDEARVLSGIVNSKNVMIHYEGRWRPVTVTKRPVGYGSNIAKLREVLIECKDSQREI